jgi:ribonuclease P protein component
LAIESMGERGRRRGRLTRSGDFDRVYRDGSSRANRHLVVYTFPTEPGAEPRLGISVSRKVGKAVTRNKVKRALREAFWSLTERLPTAHDFVIVARPGAEQLVERQGTEGIRESLTGLLFDQDSDSGDPPGQERLS